jgi:hypothetical protein
MDVGAELLATMPGGCISVDNIGQHERGRDGREQEPAGKITEWGRPECPASRVPIPFGPAADFEPWVIGR